MKRSAEKLVNRRRCRNRVGRPQVGHGVSGRRRLEVEGLALSIRQHEFGPQAETLVSEFQTDQAPQGRYTRQRSASLSILCVHQVQAEIEPEVRTEADAKPRLRSGEPAVSLDEVDDGQAALFLAGCEGEDEVAEVVVEEIDFAVDSSRLLTQGQIESVASLGLQTGIAHLEDQCAHVRTQVVEFLECRDPERVGKVGDEGPARPQVRVQPAAAEAPVKRR